MRPPTACVTCRTRKRKCEVTHVTAPCIYCTSHKLQCSLSRDNVNHHDSTSRPDGTSPLSPVSSTRSFSPPATRHERMPSLSLREELVELYFRYIHDTFHSLFHKPSLLEDVRSGAIPKVILLSIIGLAARFSQHRFFENTDPRTRGKPYAAEAAQLFDLRDVSITTIQASVLLGAYAIAEGESVAESIYYSIGCRLAMLMDLPNMPVSSRLDQETNIRTWWTLNMIDVWSSNGVGLPRSLQPRNDVPYPMEEVVFLQMRRESPHIASPSSAVTEESEASLLTQMVKLNAILFEISELNRVALSDAFVPQMAAVDFDASVDTLGRKLDDWYANIPLQLKDTPQNLERYASFGLGYIFVAVYLGYYHFGQLLYYQYLDENIFAEDFVQNEPLGLRAAQYADRCKAYSTALCEILYRAYSTPGCEVYYSMVGHVVVVASTIQLFILLFSPLQSDTALARERLSKNFEILTQLQAYWATLDVSFNKFREFHDACLSEEKRESSFRVDRWMLQFLFEFARPVAKRNFGMSLNDRREHRRSDVTSEGRPMMIRDV